MNKRKRPRRRGNRRHAAESATPPLGEPCFAGVNPADPAITRGAAHLYSGGADSSLAACRLGRRFPKVYLNTFDRFGFVATHFSSTHFERMRKRFPQTEFIHQVVDVGGFYTEIESRRFYPSLKKHGFLVLNSCGHCKVSLHWRNLIFCLEKNLRYAADGAVMGAEEFAEQNPRILLRELEGLYRHFGITLLHPTYEEGLDTQRALYELGITDQRRVKMTTKDMQVVCTQHITFAMMMRVYLSKRTFTEYENNARAYLKEKLDHVKRETEIYLARPGRDSLVARMLGR